MVDLKVWDLNEWIFPIFAFENIGQRRFAYFALKLSPVNTRVIFGGLSIFLGLEPAPQA